MFIFKCGVLFSYCLHVSKCHSRCTSPRALIEIPQQYSVFVTHCDSLGSIPTYDHKVLESSRVGLAMALR